MLICVYPLHFAATFYHTPLLFNTQYTNPCLSIKDRIVIQMLDDAEAKGEVKPGETTIVDVTSGNTGK